MKPREKRLHHHTGIIHQVMILVNEDKINFKLNKNKPIK